MVRCSRHELSCTKQSGFTLIELLIAIGILLILATLTVASYSATTSAERIRSSARQIQSAVGGGRDRAIKFSQPRGIRFLVDANNPATVTSMVYIGGGEIWNEGFILVGRRDNSNVIDGPDVPGGTPDGHADNAEIKTIRGYGVGWKNLFDQGLLTDGSRIKITGAWYTVSTEELRNYDGRGPEILRLTSEYRNTIGATPFGLPLDLGLGADPGTNDYDDDGDGNKDQPYEVGWPTSNPADADTTDIIAFPTLLEYQLELKATVLPGQEPLKLSNGIAIDLYRSVIPQSWFNHETMAKGTPVPTEGRDRYGYINNWGPWVIQGTDPFNSANDIYRQYSPRMDILFSPGGSVNGPLSARGLIHLRLADTQDIALGRDPANPEASPMYYSSIFTQTGFVATFNADITDAYNNATPSIMIPDGLADNPLQLVLAGSASGR